MDEVRRQVDVAAHSVSAYRSLERNVDNEMCADVGTAYQAFNGTLQLAYLTLHIYEARRDRVRTPGCVVIRESPN